MLKEWNVDEVARKMPSRLLTEWISFMKLENEEEDKSIKEAQLKREATQGIEQMRAKRGRR